ncbi:uncharacterized protein [Lepisosteus oculatus]|uniref:uncharacterized protein n=1 Tax=Lepisosteus oculatus TaxID=7918 RepID=UPI0035F50A4D
MSAVWLHVGQCGNQLGLEWWRWVSERPSKDRYPFCSSDGSLAAVCVDSEPKVLRRTQKLVKSGSLRESNIIAGQGGRGSNWAYGYHGAPAEGESSLLSRAMESVRREVERKDCYCGTVLFHSLSGGTGAGLGARLCEEIREQYPAGHILSVSVVPHHHGESPLQHYNSLLSLAALQRSADGVLLFHNDEALSQALTLQGRGLARAHGLPPQASLAAMNSCMASCLVGLLLPVRSLTTTSGLSLGLEPWELLRSVCPLPAAKFLHTGQACSRGNTSWDSLASSSLQSLPRHSPSGKPHYSRAVLAVARGDQDGSFLSTAPAVSQKLRLGHRCVSWNPFPLDFWTDPRDEPSPSLSSRSLTVCSNHSSVEDLLQRVGQRAQDMLRARAYLHWYQRYGCEPHDFLQALDTLSAVTQEYSAGGEQGGEADAEWRG